MILSFSLKLFGEKRFVYSVKGFPTSIKSIKAIQKFMKILVFMFLFLTNSLISLGICSTPKESK